MTVWAFNTPDAPEQRKSVYQSIQQGFSRFGWSYSDECNLRTHFWSKENAPQRFLLRIKPGDWVVHVNIPHQGKCTVAQVTSEYTYDEGLKLSQGVDFRHAIGVDPASILEFDRNSPNVLPSVNLKFRGRFQRARQPADFLKSVENLKAKAINLKQGESRQKHHLKTKTNEYLPKIAGLIQEMNKGKDLERFMAEVFRRVAGVVDVVENGFGWKTDHGADLIVTMCTSLGHLQIENKIIVQIKSFTGEHVDTAAVEHVKTGIKMFSGSAGMVITTAKKTKSLEDKIQAVSEEIELPIDVLDAEDVARFVIKHAPDLLFQLDGIS